MTRFDDLDRALNAYFDGETVAPAPTGLLELVAAATTRHRPRTTWLARVRERGLQPTGDHRQATDRRPVSRGVLVMVGLVVLALLAAVVVVGGRWIDERRQPPPIELPGGWTAVPPHLHGGDALALLKDGRVLFIGGPGHTAGDIFDPKTNAFVGIGSFDGTGPMSQPREFPSVITLLDGRVLVVGGQTPDGADLATAELFDPATGTFSQTGSMALAISGPAATLLPDGRVLIIGLTRAGEDGTSALEAAEIYAPGTGRWTEVAAIAGPETGQASTLLKDGRVLLTGGNSAFGGVLPTATVFDPATGTSGPHLLMMSGHSGQTATRLADGRVLIAGGNVTGNGTGGQASAEVFDPGSGRFVATGPLMTGRTGHTATLLADGRVLIAGGTNTWGTPLSAELYDPATGTFRVAASAAQAPGGAAVLLGDGRVLFADGSLFDPASTTSVLPTAPRTDHVFATTGEPTDDRAHGHTATRLLDGRVLIVGGSSRHQGDGRNVAAGEATTASAEIYDPSTGTFARTGSLAEPTEGHTAILLRDGRVLIVGRWGPGVGQRSARLETFDPATGVFTTARAFAPIGPSRGGITVAQLPDGRLILFTSSMTVEPNADAVAFALDPVTFAATRIATVDMCVNVGKVVALADGRVIVTCMLTDDGGDPTESVRIFDPATGRSSPLDLPSGTGGFSMALAPDGHVLFASDSRPGDLAVFDPATGQVVAQGQLPFHSGSHSLTPLMDGSSRALVFGAEGSMWDWTTGKVSPALTPIAPRQGQTATLLADGRVLLVGGTTWPADSTVPYPAGAEFFDPSALP